METIFKHVSEIPLSLAVACPTKKYPAAVQQLLDLLLAKEREDRLQSAEQLERLLQAIIDKNKTGLAELNSLSTKVKRRLGRQGQSESTLVNSTANDKKLLVAAVLAGLIAAGGIAAFLLQDKAVDATAKAKVKASDTAGKPTEEKSKVEVQPVAQDHPIYNEAPSELGLIDQVMNPSDQSRLHLIEHELQKGKESFTLPKGYKLKKPDFVAIGKGGQNLKKLEIEGCGGLDADNLKELQALPLSEVHVKWGDIDDSGMAAIFRIVGLRNLSITACNGLTPKVFDTLGEAKRLVSLQMENGQADGRFFAKKPPTEWLSELSFTGMRAFNSNHVAKIVNTDLITQRLSNCSQLKTVVFEGSDISDAGIKWLTKLPHLERLVLTRGKVSDAAIPLFLQMKSLRFLDLSGTRVSPSAMERLLKSSKIKTVSISPDGQFAHLTPYLREQMNSGRIAIH